MGRVGAGHVFGWPGAGCAPDELRAGPAPLHVAGVTGRLGQATNLAQLAVLNVDPVDGRTARSIAKPRDAERQVFAVAAWVQSGGGRAVGKRAQDPFVAS